MLKYVRILQKAIVILLLVVLSLILFVSTVNIIFTILKVAAASPEDFFTAERLHSLFSVFLVILIGIELLDTVKVFLEDEKIHVEIVLLVAMIAIARKVIVWDFSEFQDQELFGLSAMMIALALSYAIVKGTWLKSAVNKWLDGKRKHDSSAIDKILDDR